MDNLEYIKTVKLGKMEFGFMASLKIFIVGLAIDFREDEDYYYSFSIGLGLISFNLSKPKEVWTGPTNNSYAV